MIDVLIMTTLDDTRGAGRASRELAMALDRAGVGRVVLFSPDTARRILGSRYYYLWLVFFRLSRLLSRLLKGMNQPAEPVEYFSPTLIGVPFFVYSRLVAATNTVILTWIEAGLLSWKARNRIADSVSCCIWRLSDLAAITGGCHYPLGCSKFLSTCTRCPQLRRHTIPFDLAGKLHQRKLTHRISSNMQIVTPSSWLASLVDAAPVSAGIRVSHIRTAVDLAAFFPASGDEKLLLRQRFGVRGFCIVAGAVGISHSPRKGYQGLLGLEEILKRSTIESTLIVFGADSGSTESYGDFLRISVPHVVDKAQVREILASADLFFAPYEQDNQPNTVIEAFATGLPVLARCGSGLTELVSESRAGWLYTELNERLLEEIVDVWRLDGMEEFKASATSYVKRNHDIATIGKQYRTLIGQ